MKIRKDDNVILLAGKDKGKKGKVVRALPRESKVIVEGLNMTKRHVRPRKEGQKGEIISLPAPVHVSNVALVVSKPKPAKVASKKVVSDKKTHKK
jgi:large subunit ribosomal protein L24